MESLIKMIRSKKPESFGNASELAAKTGAGALPLLRDEFSSNDDISVKIKVMKIMAAIDDPSVERFFIDALENDLFEIRRRAALSLKVLTGEDYFSRIYKSGVGQSFRGNFWCDVDFIGEELRSNYRSESEKTTQSFAQFFSKLQSEWTYTESEETGFFTADNRKKPQMAEDGLVLFQNFGYALFSLLESCKYVLYLTGSINRVLDSEDAEDSEKEDILRCIRLSLGTRFSAIEEAAGIFMGTFHYVRTEAGLVLRDKKPVDLQDVVSTVELTESEKVQADKLTQGFKGFEELRGHPEVVSSKRAEDLVFLCRRAAAFLGLCGEFASVGEINDDSYLILKKIGVMVNKISLVNMNLLSAWRFEE